MSSVIRFSISADVGKMSGVDSVNSEIEAKCKINSRELAESLSNTLYNYLMFQFEVCHPVRAKLFACTRVTVGVIDIDMWIFWALLLLCLSLFIVLRGFSQREDEGAVEHEDLPHPIQVQDD